MSRITNPETEQYVSCGFFNSNNDRRYDAVQMSSIFDGVIVDGIFGSIGDKFNVTAGSGTTVNVGTGKCWFNHTWTLNEAILPMDCGESEIYLDRYDAIVIEVNTTEAVRDNFIKVVKGTPSAKPAYPVLIKNGGIYQYPLCYIYRKAESTEITQAEIRNAIGTSETPFVTSILKAVSIDDLLGQWQTQLDQFVDSEEADLDTFMEGEKADLEAFMSAQEDEYQTWFSNMAQLMADVVTEIDTWTENQRKTIISWFEGLKVNLSGDVAVNLQFQIDEKEIENYIVHGLSDGTKTFSDDGRVITTVDSEGRKLTKTFSSDFLICTTVLTDINGGELGRLVKTFSSDGKSISSELTII